MEMWNWLQPWWNWWAGFTGLFEWDAIAALATAAAAIIALWVSTQTRRDQQADERRRSIHKVKALFVVGANGYVLVKTGLSDAADQGVAPELAAQRLRGGIHLEELRKSYSFFSPESFDTTASVDLLMSSRAMVENVISGLERMERQDPKGAAAVASALDQWDDLLLAIAREIRRLGGGIEDGDDPLLAPWMSRI